MEQLVNVIVNTGTAICVTAYFLYRDFKFNNDLVILMATLKELVQSIKEDLEKE